MALEGFRRSLRAVAALAVLACFGFGLVAEHAGAAPPTPRVTWTACHQDLGPFECGNVNVPLDHNGNGGTVSIAMVKLPATDPSQRIGSLFLNPGGPGGSGVNFVLFAGPILFNDDVRARFDIVGFDPRGIIRSTPLRCFGNPAQWAPYFTPFIFPMTPEQEAIWITADRYLIDACDRRGGEIMNHMSTASVARDLDLLRQAVGDEQLNYVGYSYGSYLGVTYANLFPDKVRALIVDGVLDPIAWSTGVGDEAETLPFSYRLRSDAGAQATLDEFFRLCDAGGANCPFAPDSAQRFADLADELLADPLELPDGSVLDYSNLIGISLGAMYDSFSWPFFAQLLADIEGLANLNTVSARVQAFQHRPMYMPARIFPHYPNFVEGFPSVVCSDSDNPDNYPAWSAAGAAADEQFGYFGRLWTWVSSLCAEWSGADQDRYMGPFTANTSNPVLVVGTQFDPATRYEGAVTVAGLLPNSALLTVHGWGHTSIFLSACADSAIASYLLTVATPAPGTVCEQDVVPFAP
jgi:pimeloyl-ACP methyl ester carboxylesterase